MTAVRTTPRTIHLLGAGEAREAHAAGAVFLEIVPWRSAQGEGAGGSIPGAIAVPTTEVLAGEGGGTAGHLPLPEVGAVWGWLAERGVSPAEDEIIVYVRQTSDFNSAARAWFVLRWAGAISVRILDGQLDGWVEAGGALDAHPADRVGEPRPVIVPDDAGTLLPTLDADEAAEIAEYGTLLDARPAGAYIGSEEQPRSGHIPGADSAPASEISLDGRLLSEPELRKWFLRHRAIGGHPVGAYCGGGVASAGLVFALATLGESLPIYIGSWSAWSADPERPVERGAGSGAVSEDC